MEVVKRMRKGMIPHACQTQRAGLSLMEVLVVIAIISVVMALTFAAVQRARSSAARARCQNNLRQIGVAVQNYHAAENHFPKGVTGPNDLHENYPYMTWILRIMPYLDQISIWSESVAAFQSQANFQVDPPHVHRSRTLPVLSCPLDGRVRFPASFSLQSGGENLYGLTSYLGVEGINRFRADGLLHLGVAYRFTDITDGASNTLLIGERPPSFDLRFGWWYAGEGMDKDGTADSVMGVRTRCRRPNYCGECGEDPLHFQPGKFDNPCSMLHFWSPHPGGAHFAFADGSVRFLRYSANDIMPALATRAGGEFVIVPE